MSDESELQQLRQQKLAELRRQQNNALSNEENAQRQEQHQMQQEAFEAQKRVFLLKILDSEALSRLANIRLTRPNFAETIEMQLIQAFQMHALPDDLPLSDSAFKNILIKIQSRSGQREQKISFR